MEITNDTYTIALQPGESQFDFYGMVTEIVDEFSTNDQIFVANMTPDQATALRNDDRVIGVDNMMEVNASEEEDADNTLDVRRTGVGYQTSPGYNPDKGNWNIHRHTSLTQNFAAQNTDYTMNFSYPQHEGVDVDGTGVDLVACISGVPDITNDGYKTGGTTRIEDFQWNTLTGLSGLDSIDYTTATSNPHGEAVLAFACHNTYGWAKGAKIYIMPRTWENYTQWWNSVRLFHKAKVDAGGTVRPTIFFASFGYSVDALPSSVIHFRGTTYTTYRGEGVSGISQQRDYLPIGLMKSVRRSDYGTVQTSVANMEAEGVFNVVTPGNKGQKNDVPGGPDYNNYFTTLASPATYYYNRKTSLAGDDTIIVGNMDSSFGQHLPGEETLWPTTNRGPRIDCVMGGTNLTLDQTHWGDTGDYTATGTSFVSPQVAGILAIVLQKYPDTTPAQARKYFREHAIGTDKLYDPGVTPISDGGDHGDSEYFASRIGLQGYSGNILYFDPALAFDPSGIADATITYPTENMGTSRLNYTVDQINAILAKAD
jgi:hypothetical protein